MNAASKANLARAPSPPAWRRRTARGEWLVLAAWLGALCTLSWVFQAMTRDTIWSFVLDAPAQARDIAARMLPPDASFMTQLWRPLWETFNMATLGTLLGALIAIPLAFLAADNTTPHRWLVRPAALLIIAASRSINTLIWGLLLVAVLGPGSVAGVIAIALRSIGFVGKLVYESIEEADPVPIEAVAATGASGVQVVAWAVVPQVAPAAAAICIFRWDINIRESTVLGLVGAGGIGVKLEAALGVLAWPKVATVLLCILATVVFSEWVTARVRRRLI